MQCFMQSSSYAPVNANPSPLPNRGGPGGGGGGGGGGLAGKVVSFYCKFVPDDGGLGQ
jgi:hypothetical protein